MRAQPFFLLPLSHCGSSAKDIVQAPVAGTWPTTSPWKLPCLTTTTGLPCTCGSHDAGVTGKYFILQSVSLCGLFSHLHWTGLLASTSGDPCKCTLQGFYSHSTA
ncbi:uncharacterized protein LOC111664982 isoform X2 [Seriola lalandi dorsalis]|uniref:uncharacterized protein LOC111664982 isoform X2 n=1 Tax=Seriola lalandi dorsalis TaxID=1841481 RepID=UPI000C6FC71A|nr:uncharacterized protein LOC111664982 isoform X2 [Seriola lalandi dorsalis]